MKIQILGTGCPKCKTLASITEQNAKELGLDFELEKITDITEIMSFGVMVTPALVINGNIAIKGQLPSDDELKSILKENS